MTDATGAHANEQVDLTSMRVADLQGLASKMGIRGAARLRKGELVRAIEEARDAAAPAAPEKAAPAKTTAKAPAEDAATSAAADTASAREQEAAASSEAASTAEAESPAAAAPARKSPSRRATSKASSAATSATTSSDTASSDATSSDGKTADAVTADASAPADDQTAAAAEPSEAPKEQAAADTAGSARASGRRRDANGAQRRSGAREPENDPIAAAIFPDEAASKQPESAGGAGDGEAASPLSLDDLVLPPARGEAGDAEDGEHNAGRRRRVAVESGSDDSDGDGSRDDDGDGDSGRGGSRRRNRGRRGRSGEATSSGHDDDDSSSDDQNQGRGRRTRGDAHDDGDDRRGRGRYRDRKRGRGDDVDPEISPDDVLLPIAGILDVLDNYAFVRTSGYLPGQNDVYVSLAQVKKYGLRKGDAIVGAVRQPREGEQPHGRQKFNAIVKFDTINGQSPDEANSRASFDDLTALYPEERLRLETESGRATQRMIDLFAPIGKGTRGLIVAPPKAGKSVVLQQIANAIAENSPQTHLMLVLVDERPEEVTSMRRTIRGEVIASTFDLPAEDHTTIAELAIERAKRLVELGHDVVVLLDSITALCRAYNLTAPASGRILAGGVDASALYPPKRFFGAARNVENGGSLTILATAMIETGSRTDEVILEEFAGKGNMELRLSREIADKRIFPALDISHSSTMHEEQLLSPAEVDVTWGIRRELSHGQAQAALEAVLDRITATSSNEEFLRSVRETPIVSPGQSR